MIHNPRFYGSAKMNERGQVVLPADLRHDLGLEAGEKFLVVSGPNAHGIMLLRADTVGDMFSELSKQVTEALQKNDDDEGDR